MHLDDATKIIGRLKAAFPVMSLDEEQGEVLLREVALLHDPKFLDEAINQLIKREERFPSIARIRLAYRAISEAHSTARAALERAPGQPLGDRSIPEWVQVWEWRRRKTLTARQEANGKTNAPVEERNPVRMRDFPQLMGSAPDAYTWDEYEHLRQGWVADGSPSIRSAAELGATVKDA